MCEKVPLPRHYTIAYNIVKVMLQVRLIEKFCKTKDDDDDDVFACLLVFASCLLPETSSHPRPSDIVCVTPAIGQRALHQSLIICQKLLGLGVATYERINPAPSTFNSVH